MSPTTDGGPLVALSRTLSGGHLLFHSISAPQIPAAQSNKDFKEERVTLAPLSSTSGQISLVPLDGTVEMRVLQGSFLAATSKLSLAARLGGLGWVVLPFII